MLSTLFIVSFTLCLMTISYLTSFIATLFFTLQLILIVFPFHSIPSPPMTLLTMITTLQFSFSLHYLLNPLLQHSILFIFCHNFYTFIYTFLFINSTSQPHFLMHFLYVDCFHQYNCCMIHQLVQLLLFIYFIGW